MLDGYSHSFIDILKKMMPKKDFFGHQQTNLDRTSSDGHQFRKSRYLDTLGI